MTLEELQLHISRQLQNIMCVELDISDALPQATAYVQEMMKRSNNKYYMSSGGGLSPFHTGMYTNLLYWLARELYLKDGHGERAEKVYYLNKILNSVDIFYAVEMPSCWDVEHPLGSVMGRGQYGNYFFFYQGCTIGGNGKDYPVLGEHVTMLSNSKVLGHAHVGNFVTLAANAYVIDCDVPDDSLVFPSVDGRHPIIVQRPHTEMQERAASIWK